MATNSIRKLVEKDIQFVSIIHFQGNKHLIPRIDRGRAWNIIKGHYHVCANTSRQQSKLYLKVNLDENVFI